MSNLNHLALIHGHNLTDKFNGQRVRVLGIDLGTTNSSLSEIDWKVGDAPGPQPACVEVAQNTLDGQFTHSLLPSVVALYQGRVFIGEGAKRLRARAPEFGLRHNQDLFYDCKNDIGIRRTYHKAPEGFRSAAEIGGRVISHLLEEARSGSPTPIERVVVTVPASFQAAQRQDTITAARLAGLEIAGGDLLDEPIAAFLGYLHSHDATLLPQLHNPKNLLVFDFGGGTCDVALFQLHKPSGVPGPIEASTLSVSRYHRLGGGDIDAAIVHEVLIPELCNQNSLDPLDLTFEVKKMQIEPALLGLAEMLKIGLCTEIRHRQNFGKYDNLDRTQIVKTQPGVSSCWVNGRETRLSSPRLSAAEFEKVLEPFLDRDFLYPRETEYRTTCSIFAPLSDALDRGGITNSSVDFCLAVGGASLIPQILDALRAFLPQAELLTFPDRDSVKTCVSRGAALHALARSLLGTSLIHPVCNDAIAIRTESGAVELLPKGQRLPFPSGGTYASTRHLAVPRSAKYGEECQLRVEIVAADDNRPLLSTTWTIPGPVKKGSPIRLEYCLDDNQVLHLRAGLADNETDDHVFEATIENPLSHVANPQPKRLKIEQLEEQMRTGQVCKEELPETMAEVASLYADLNQHEKAIDYLRRAIRAMGAPDVALLNRLAGYYGTIGDTAREDKAFQEAANVSSWSGTWFNWSLALTRKGEYLRAEEAIGKCLVIDREAPYLVQSAKVARSLGKHAEAADALREALSEFGPVKTLTDWELSWFATATQMAGESELLASADAERRKRAKSPLDSRERAGDLPIITPGIGKPKR